MQGKQQFILIRYVSFLKSRPRTALRALIVLGLLLSGASPCFASWEKDDMGFGFHEQNRLVIGDGRDDGTIRVYAGDADGGIYEFSFAGDDWDKASVGQVESGVCGLAIGGARNDTIIGVYASGYNLAEYWYDSSSWLGGSTGSYDQYTNDLALGNARNDGTNRIYLAANWGGIYELSYDGSAWEYEVIANPAPLGYVGVVALGNGRNDGMNRVYSWYSPSLYVQHMAEYTFDGAWSATSYLDSVVVADIAVGNGRNDGVDRVYIACDDNHVYEYSFVSTFVESEDPTPCLCLGQIYPNPFIERTSIHYSLTRLVHVTLDIYDLRGNLVHTIVDRIEGAGEHTVDWDGSNQLGIPMVPGVYVCRLETQGFTQTSKLLLIR